MSKHLESAFHRRKPIARHTAQFTCEICMQDLNLEKAFRKHCMDEHNITKPFKCGKDSCAKTFKTQNTLRNHSTTHYQHKLFYCTTCGSSHKTQLLLRLHQRIHVPNRNFSCDVRGCTKTFKSKGSLYFHKKTIHFPTSISRSRVLCPYCKKSLLKKASLRYHINATHNLTATSIYCDTCSKPFKSQMLLDRHKKRMHSAGTGFICWTCGKVFGLRNELKKHCIRHNTQGSWMCDICGRSFHFKFVLEKHQRSHSDERPFSCHVCPAAYKDKYKLKQHVKKLHNKETSSM